MSKAREAVIYLDTDSVVRCSAAPTVVDVRGVLIADGYMTETDDFYPERWSRRWYRTVWDFLDRIACLHEAVPHSRGAFEVWECGATYSQKGA